MQPEKRSPAAAGRSLPSPPPEPASPVLSSFHQLDRLHSLVEQLLELRTKNARLFRRVRELERLKALRRLENNSCLALPADEAELAFAESLLGSFLESAPTSLQPQPQPGCRQRSRSIGTESRPPLIRATAGNKRSSCHLQLDSKRHSIGQPPKVSKWTKVKAAFRWERAAAAFLEQDRFLRPAEAGPANEVLSRLSSSTASSSATSSTDELCPKQLTPGSRAAAPRTNVHRISLTEARAAKTPWAMVKDILQSRRDRANRGSVRSEDGYSLSSSLDSSADALLQDGDKLAQQQQPPSLTITLPSSEELRSLLSSPESSGCNDEHSPTTTTTTTDEATQPRPLHRQDSKWNKVKRAFLSGSTSTASVPASPSSRMSSAFFDDNDTGRSYSASVEDLDKSVEASSPNYQILNDKLSEWEKGSSKNGSIRTATSSPKDKDSANALLMGEEQLTPEFKKKLQEWKRMKKTSPGTTSPEQQQQQQLFRRRLTDWQIWRTASKTEGKTTDSQDSGKPQLSEEFLRKMDEWKKIKSASATTRSDEEQSERRSSSCATESHSPNIPKKRCLVEDREFVPLDKIISMVEREQSFIEKQREKLLDKNSRGTDRISDSTSDKREVLVHTSSGFYRFQGISQEFTRKLYEWEKSQGIAPEYSTLQLLNPTFRISPADRNDEINREKCPQPFKRSKSMSSLVEPTSLRANTPIRQPSSLSLNDATNLENDAKLRIDSKQTIGEEEDLLAGYEDSEPEAVIVDIEDVIEETASPMAKFQPQQTPVYCVTASETTSIAIPLGTVTASHEPSPVILIQAGETHHRIRKHRISQIREVEAESVESSSLQVTPTPSQIRVTQVDESDENRKRLYEPSDISVCETIIEEEASASRIEEESSRNRADTKESTACANEASNSETRTGDKTEDAVDGNDAVITVGSEIRQRKVLKTRRLTDSQVGYKWREQQEDDSKNQDETDALTVSPFPENPSVERIIINESTLNKIVVPTASNEQISQIVEHESSETSKQSKTSVFVKTKRIIFSPFSRRSIAESCPPAVSVAAAPTCRPPLPQSPVLCRKEYRRASPPKETAPSIRMMIQRYNQKLQEDAGSPASSGSGSPIWRSPSSERRVRTQTERYQEELRRAVCQSRKASLQNKNPEIFSNIQQSLVHEFKTLPMKSDARAQRIQRAKDEFLSRGPGCHSHEPSSAQSPDGVLEVGKSASAGTINADSASTTFDRLRQSKTEFTGTLSKIASKFRRAKLKKVKDKDKMATVSMLCRQSLLVDILQPPEETSKSCPTSPSPSQRDGSAEERIRLKQHRDSS